MSDELERLRRAALAEVVDHGWDYDSPDAKEAAWIKAVRRDERAAMPCTGRHPYDDGYLDCETYIRRQRSDEAVEIAVRSRCSSCAARAKRDGGAG